MARIDRCGCGHVHVHIGPFSLRLETEIFVRVAGVFQEAAIELDRLRKADTWPMTQASVSTAERN